MLRTAGHHWFQQWAGINLRDQPPPEPDEGLLSVQYINENVCNHVYDLIVLDAYLDIYLTSLTFIPETKELTWVNLQINVY